MEHGVKMSVLRFVLIFREIKQNKGLICPRLMITQTIRSYNKLLSNTLQILFFQNIICRVVVVLHKIARYILQQYKF